MVDHIALLPWLLVEPHCATQAASGFPDSIKKVQKGKGDAQKEAASNGMGVFFKPGTRGAPLAFFCHGLPPFRVKPCYLVESAP